ncbi:hypothetical protein D3C85_1426300 [compost metagenome]
MPSKVAKKPIPPMPERMASAAVSPRSITVPPNARSTASVSSALLKPESIASVCKVTSEVAITGISSSTLFT